MNSLIDITIMTGQGEGTTVKLPIVPRVGDNITMRDGIVIVDTIILISDKMEIFVQGYYI